MNVKEMRSMLRGLPDDMLVMMPLGDGASGITVCKDKSGVQEVELEEGITDVMLLLPCTCSTEIVVDQQSIADDLILNPASVQ